MEIRGKRIRIDPFPHKCRCGCPGGRTAHLIFVPVFPFSIYIRITTTSAMFKEELPQAVYKELDRRGLNGVPVLLSTTSELSLSGRPERNWIVATRYNVAAVREADRPTVETHVPVAEVREFRTHSTIGSGFLQAYVDDYWVDLARFPNTEADRFSRLARYLEDLRTDGEVQIETDSTPKVTHCPKCTQRLPVANESCARCI